MSGSLPLSRRAFRAKDSRSSQPLAVVPSRPGDNTAVQHFLTSIFRGPAPAEFRATCEHPYHEPRDRLLLKRGHEVLGHALVMHCSVRLGHSVVSAAQLHDLATSPALRDQGFGDLLLRRAERHMLDEGHVLGLLATRQPAFFRKYGWIARGRRNRFSANACRVRSVLAAKGLYPKVRRPLDIRPLRRMEVADVARIYRLNVEQCHGPLERSEACWQWLISRNAYDEFLVAIDHGKGRRSASRKSKIVGYAILKNDRIVELFTLPDHTKAGVQLLSRACGEAIEHGTETLLVDLPPRHPLGRLLKAAEATAVDRHVRNDEVLMAKVFDPVQMLMRLGGELRQRAVGGQLSMPLDFGLAVENKKYRISMDAEPADPPSPAAQAQHGVQVTSGGVGRSYLRLDRPRLTELLLGKIDWSAPTGIEASTKLAEQAATVLFPRRVLWRPGFDDLPAGG